MAADAQGTAAPARLGRMAMTTVGTEVYVGPLTVTGADRDGVWVAECLGGDPDAWEDTHSFSTSLVHPADTWALVDRARVDRLVELANAAWKWHVGTGGQTELNFSLSTLRSSDTEPLP